jgi:hypothetical protein
MSMNAWSPGPKRRKKSREARSEAKLIKLFRFPVQIREGEFGGKVIHGQGFNIDIGVNEVRLVSEEPLKVDEVYSLTFEMKERRYMKARCIWVMKHLADSKVVSDPRFVYRAALQIIDNSAE